MDSCSVVYDGGNANCRHYKLIHIKDYQCDVWGLPNFPSGLSSGRVGHGLHSCVQVLLVLVLASWRRRVVVSHD
jgi:hypothetical protein